MPFLARKRYSYLPRSDRVTGFKSPDRGRFTALFASSMSFPDREETRTWECEQQVYFFLVADVRVGVAYYIMRENFIWREFNLAIFYDSPNRQIKVLAKFSGYTVAVSGS